MTSFWVGFGSVHAEFVGSVASLRGRPIDRAERERARVRPIRGGFRVGKCHRLGAIGSVIGSPDEDRSGAGSVTRSGREVVALGLVGGLVGGRLVGRSVIKSVSVRPLRGRNLARGGADPRGSSSRTVRGKQTAQTANAVRLRRTDP